MNRKDKYPDTSYFIYNNINPKNRITSDCVYRAISGVSGLSYNDVIQQLSNFHCNTGYEATSEYGRFLQKEGWVKLKQPRKLDNTKYTGKEYCELIQSNLIQFKNEYDYTHVICNIGSHHVTCIINGRINDIWDCSSNAVGNVYVRKIK